VILPQLAKTSRMTCESVSMRGLVILRQSRLSKLPNVSVISVRSALTGLIEAA
jgi:hypothetical protein